MVTPLIWQRWRSWLPTRLIELALCASFVIFFYWQHPPASLLLLAVAAVLAWFRLEIAVALLPLTFPYYLFLIPLGRSGFPQFYLAELAILICIGVAVLRSLLIPAERRATLEWARGLWGQARIFLFPAALLLVGATLALLSAPDIHDSLRAWRQEVIEALAFFLLMLRYLRTRTDLVRAVAAMIVSGIVVSFTAIIQGVFHLTQYLVIIDFSAFTFRANGPYGSGNSLGMLIDRVFPLLLALALTHLLRRTATGTSALRLAWRDPLRWACLLALLPLLWALYWSRSRGAEVAVLAVVAFFFVVEVRKWFAIVVIGGVGVLGTVFFWQRLLAFFNEGHSGTASDRLTYWKAALSIIRNHPFLGTGPDSFGIQFNPGTLIISHPHNLFLEFWISSGLLGLLAICWLLAVFTLVIFRLYRRAASLAQANLFQRLLLGIAGAMLATFVHGMVDNTYFRPDLALMFWFFVGLLPLIKGVMAQEQAAFRNKAPSQAPLASLAAN